MTEGQTSVARHLLIFWCDKFSGHENAIQFTSRVLMGLTLMTMKVSDYVCVQLITQDECSRFALAYHTSGGFAIVVQAKKCILTDFNHWLISLVSRYRVPQMLRAKKRMFEIWMLRGTCHSTKHDYFNLIQRS